MSQMNLLAQSIGCFYAVQRTNAEIVRSLGNKSPHKLLTGQKPNQGLSALPMHPKLLANLRSEAHLKSYLVIPHHIAIKDAWVNADAAAQLNNIQSIMPTALNSIVP